MKFRLVLGVLVFGGLIVQAQVTSDALMSSQQDNESLADVRTKLFLLALFAARQDQHGQRATDRAGMDIPDERDRQVADHPAGA